MSELLYKFSTDFNKVYVYDDKIKATLFNSFGKLKKEISIPIDSVQSVQILPLKKIRFITDNKKYTFKFDQQYHPPDRYNDEYDECEANFYVGREIKKYLEKRIAEREVAQRESINSNIIAAPMSVADELSKLKSLMEDGVLTEEEFESQKQKLLQL